MVVELNISRSSAQRLMKYLEIFQRINAKAESDTVTGKCDNRLELQNRYSKPPLCRFEIWQ